MKRPVGAVTSVDSSMVVEDRATTGDREIKYTVDRFGLEQLRFLDVAAPDVKAHDRARRLLSRGLTALPGRLGDRVVEVADHVAERADRLGARVLRWRSDRRSLAEAGLVAIGPALRPRTATVVEELDTATEAQVQRELVLEALEEAEVPAVVVPAGPGKDAALAVRDGDVDRVGAALEAGLDRSWYLVRLDAPEDRPRRVTRRAVRRLCEADGGFRVFRLVAAGPDLPVAGAEVGVDVEVWRDPMPDHDRHDHDHGAAGPRAEADARYVATRRQVWTTRLPAEAWEHPDPEAALAPIAERPHLFEVTEPIDVVYTWVDGADPEWNRRRAEALGAPNGVTMTPAADHEARFRSHDELRYSLRSLETYAPWVRRIHIVTAGQVPYWLDTSHPRVNLVFHEDIFPDPAMLPVFNSHAIEACLHRIPGLAEQYLYLNDDMFFGRRVRPEQFFHGNGLAKFFLSSAVTDPGPRQPTDDAVTSAGKNNRELIAEVFGRSTTAIFQHTPHPQLRSVVWEMERTHPELFRQVAASRFRHPDDLSIPSALFHYYAYALGRAVPDRISYLYLDLGHPRVVSRLRRLLRERNVDVFCLNDTPDFTGDRAGGRQLVTRFLARYYPLPSSFEIDARPSAPTRSTEAPRQITLADR